MTKNIAVLGTGANGSCIAADLIETGFDVSLIDQWPARVEAMRANGLRIQMEDEELHVRCVPTTCTKCARSRTLSTSSCWR